MLDQTPIAADWAPPLTSADGSTSSRSCGASAADFSLMPLRVLSTMLGDGRDVAAVAQELGARIQDRPGIRQIAEGMIAVAVEQFSVRVHSGTATPSEIDAVAELSSQFQPELV